MISICDFEKQIDSDDDSEYEPPVELFSEEGKTLINYKEKTEAGIRTRNSQHLSKTDMYCDTELKDVKKSEVNLTETKEQADNIYKIFLEEAAEEMKLLKNERFSSETGSSGYSKKSCNSKNVNITEKVSETTENISSMYNNIEDFKHNLPSNSCSNLEKKSTTLYPFSSMKRKDWKSVVGNIHKKSKKETVLDMSKQDWQKFKEEEDITNELKVYNQGKKGFLERQRFLERSDLRRFQIEREMRISKRQTHGKNSD